MIKRIFYRLSDSKTRAVFICGIIFLIFLVDYIVLLTGGTEFAFTHLMYIPIILSAFLLGIWGAVGAAVWGGITLGPFMPVNVSEVIMQEPSSWIFRTVIFMIIGCVLGLLFQRIKIDKETEIKKSLVNVITGLPNANKLKQDLTELICRQNDFSLVVFRIINMDHINIYVDYTIGEKSLFKAIELLRKIVDKDTIYSIFTNEFVFVIRGCGTEDAYLKAKEYLSYFEGPISVDGLPVSLDIKCGIANYPLHGKETNDLIQKMDRTLDQENFGNYRITIYDDSISQKNKEKYDIIISLYEAIKNNQFFWYTSQSSVLKETKLKVSKLY